MTIIQKITNQIRPGMKEKGFQFSKKCFYRISNDIAYCVQFEKPGGLAYVTFYVMPLYLPCENRYFTYGNRMDRCRQFHFAPLSDSAQDAEIANWCDALWDCLERFVFPFFSQIATPCDLMNRMEREKILYFACPKVDLYRLLMFSYFYAGKMEKFSKTVEAYRSILQSSTFLTENVRNMYFSEADALERLAISGSQPCQDFCRSTIEKTLQNCF